MVLTEITHAHDSHMGVPKCNFKSSERHRVHSANKENLHSRERMVDDCFVDAGGSKALHIVEEDSEFTEGSSMNMEEVCLQSCWLIELLRFVFFCYQIFVVMIKFVVCNSRGAANKGVTYVIRDLKFRYKLDMIVLLEPRISGRHAEKVTKSWGFRYSVRMEAKGFSGGIWILWDLDDLVVDVRIMNE
ncbi:hypothetical protein K1719_021776 [Acacia pycnantha]|nr:hypothetical protein K1719_021776 [Acacia pycnantha]